MSAKPARAPSVPPTRFRDPAENNDFFLALTEKLLIRRKVTPDEFRRYGEYLWVGDASADRLAAKFHDIGMQRSVQMLDEALAGITKSDHPQELRDLMSEVEAEPQWLDKGLLAAGSRMTQRSGPLGEYVLSCVSLMGGYRSAAANKPIAFTGALEYKAARRLAETAKFSYDVTRTGGLARGAAGFKAAVKVRMMHAHVRLMLDRSPRWRHADWGLPINQADLVATNVLFSAVYLGGLRVLGLQISDEESRGVMHLWRYIGYLMGIDEALLPVDEADGTRMAWLAGVTQPGADEDSRLLGQALMNVPFERAQTPLEKAAAWFEVQLRSGFTRLVLGDRAGDDLGLPNTPLKFAAALTTPAVFAIETMRRLLPGATNLAVLAGDRLQRGMVDGPLGSRPATFAPPARLQREAAYS